MISTVGVRCYLSYIVICCISIYLFDITFHTVRVLLCFGVFVSVYFTQILTPYAPRKPWDYTNASSLQWRHNGRDSVSTHQPHDCLLNRLFRRRSKKTSKLRVTGLCAGNSPGTGEFPAQMASDVENVSSRWRHHVGNPKGSIVCVLLCFITKSFLG